MLSQMKQKFCWYTNSATPFFLFSHAISSRAIHTPAQRFACTAADCSKICRLFRIRFSLASRAHFQV